MDKMIILRIIAMIVTFNLSLFFGILLFDDLVQANIKATLTVGLFFVLNLLIFLGLIINEKRR